MKKAIFAGILFIASALFADILDTKYAALIHWSSKLADDAHDWNERCHEQKQDGCDEIKSILFEEFRFFIECAKRYSDEGTDCRAKMREKVIAHEVRRAQWNINCGAVSKASKEGIACGKDLEALDAEEQALENAGKDCTGDKI
jgi:hypothetical protein